MVRRSRADLPGWSAQAPGRRSPGTAADRPAAAVPAAHRRPCLVLLFREEEALGKAYDARLARRLLAYLRPYRGSVVLALVLTILVGPLEIVGPYLFGCGGDPYIVPASGCV